MFDCDFRPMLVTPLASSATFVGKVLPFGRRVNVIGSLFDIKEFNHDTKNFLQLSLCSR
jgi:hypothetical protein